MEFNHHVLRCAQYKIHDRYCKTSPWTGSRSRGRELRRGEATRWTGKTDTTRYAEISNGGEGVVREFARNEAGQEFKMDCNTDRHRNSPEGCTMMWRCFRTGTSGKTSDNSSTGDSSWKPLSGSRGPDFRSILMTSLLIGKSTCQRRSASISLTSSRPSTFQSFGG